MNVIIYDNKNIGYVTTRSIDYSYTIDCINCTSSIYNYKQFVKAPEATIQMQVSGINKYDNIKLDETMMKRIAKYNKEMECKRIEEEIKQKEKYLKELENKIDDREKRWKKIQNFVANIYEIDVNEDIYDDEDIYDGDY